MPYLSAYVCAAVTFLVIDFIWLSRIAKPLYAEKLGSILLDKPKIPAAAIFYAIYVVGVVIFAVAPALQTASPLTALSYGALFGFFAYATYDMTNYATLRNWPISLALLDIAWGACLTAISAVAGYFGSHAIFAPV